jgi:hypothetical protein
LRILKNQADMRNLADFEKSGRHEKSCGRHTWPMENHAEKEKMARANKMKLK